MTCRTKSGLLDLVTRVVRDHSSDLNLLRVCPKDSDWSRQRCRLGDRPKEASKDSDWSRWINLSIWRCVQLVVLPDGSDWTRRETCLLFWDATDWTVRWTCLARTLMIGWSADLISASSFGFFVAWFQTAKRDWRENDYAKASSFGDEYAVLICSWSQNIQN